MRGSGTVTVGNVMEPFKVGTNEFLPPDLMVALVAPFGTAECPYGGISFDRK